ncbi:MAG: ABC transporter permease [Spirochaetaceae bacterium]|nr:ABC transporter permease [Spirochaetaceae bacterium]
MGLILKLALRTIGRRKGRMALIGGLVAFGTFLVVFGTTLATSAAAASREAIVRNFTGDFILYAERSRDIPSPFAFNTPLPAIPNLDSLEAALGGLPDVESWTAYAQNYGLIQVEREGRKLDLPFIFYAVEPSSFGKVFENVSLAEGSFFGARAEGKATPIADPAAAEKGVAISLFQNEQYLKNYGVSLEPGEQVTLLGITEGGVNSLRSRLVGTFEPRKYKSVFNYINFMDSASYATLYGFSGVEALPDSFNAGLAAAAGNEDAIFGLAEADFGSLDLGSLVAAPLSGATMVAVRLKEGADVDAVMAAALAKPGLGVKAARWDAASGFYAQIASALQAFIYVATALVFLVVALIFMNTLIINVVERTGEIGTMRALGSERSFVSGLFLAEALILNLGSALVAMILAGGAILAFGKGGLPLPETVSQFLIGGGPLALRAGVLPFIQAFAVVLLVSVLATIWPVRVATAITPLKAMSDR